MKVYLVVLKSIIGKRKETVGVFSNEYDARAFANTLPCSLSVEEWVVR